MIVSNVTSSTQALFSSYDTVSDVAVITDGETGRSRGFGFVTMDDDNAAREAIEAINGTELDGRSLTVNEAKARADRGRGGGGDGRGGFRACA